MQFRATRLIDAPIITPALDPSIGVNIQGPSLIRAPAWITDPLGAYYLYFADHKGDHIRLAVADSLAGPWRIYPGGSLHLAESLFLTASPAVSAEQLAAFEAQYRGRAHTISHNVLEEITTPHIASPDVHVDAANRQVLMYFHGLDDVGTQVSRLAVSSDGIVFTVRPEILGRSYMRVFRHGGASYALTMPGTLSRSVDGLGGFEPGPALFNPGMRHAALLQRGDTLWVFWTQVGDVPECILMSPIPLVGDWRGWRDGPAVEVMRPERAWEGADAPLLPSVRSTAYGLVNQLRDPAVFEEAGVIYLLYAVGGESGIGIARLDPG